MNGLRYRDFLTIFFGPTCHTDTEKLNLLRLKFLDLKVSRISTVNKPPRSRDSTLFDYFLWDNVKGQVYLDNAQSIKALKTTISRVISEIESQL